MEDAERQCQTLDYRPGQEAIKFELHRVSLHLLRLESIDDPHGDIADEEECDDLTAWLGTVVLWKVDTPT